MVVDAMALFLNPSPYFMAVTDNSPSVIIESAVKSAGRASAFAVKAAAAATMAAVQVASACLKSINLLFMLQNYNQTITRAITTISEKTRESGYMRRGAGDYGS